MWSLSLPQVAATLAAALAGVEAGLISDSIFNVVIVLMLVTAIAGPILTTNFARKLSIAISDDSAREYYLRHRNSKALNPVSGELNKSTARFRVIVPVANPATERNLIEMGALLARHEQGKVISLSIAKAHVQMDDPELKRTITRSRQLLKQAVAVTKEFGAVGKSLIRIDDDVVQGITRAAREERANLIVMGWSRTTNLRSRLFGNAIDGVFWSAHCPVAVMRLLKEPIDIHSVLVPIKSLNARSKLTIEFALLFAETNQAAITLLHISDRSYPTSEVSALERQLQNLVTEHPQLEIVVRVIRHDNTTESILAEAKNYDLVILRSTRLRTAGGLAVSDISDRLVRQLDSSFILFGEPH